MATPVNTLSKDHLSPTQRRILRLILDGRNTQEIADAVGWRPSTTRVRICEICQFFGIQGGMRGLLLIRAEIEKKL